MNLKTQLIEDMKQAMKAKDTIKLGVVRFLRSEIKNFEIDNGEQDDKGVVRIIASQVKKIKDVLVDFKSAGRDDLVAKEEAKVAILEAYLPQQMSDEELREVVSKIVGETEDKVNGEAREGALGQKNVGKLIGVVIRVVDGKADGGRVSAMVKEQLQ
ncbi:GatB/YqeY domain-containing protein [Patescibacteria group bacterium]|nr:GatB/YqeY domain-containing protein [Patescibacteria group bacterium]